MPSPNPDLPFLQSSLGEDFPDGLVVKTLSFHCRGGIGPVLGWGSSSCLVVQPRQNKTKNQSR